MKAYNEYMDSLSVSDTLHRRFAACAEGAGPVRRPITFRRYAAAFVCLAVILVGALAVPRLFFESGTADFAAIGPDSNKEQSLPSAIIIEGSDLEGADACYPVPSPGSCLYFTEVRKAMEEYAGTDAVLFLALDIFTEENRTELTEDEIQAEVNRLSALGYRIGYSEAWTYRGKGEKVPYTYLSGLFTVDELQSFKACPDYGYALRFAHNGDGSPVKADLSVFEPSSKALDSNEAYADSNFGAYLPMTIPSGFAFESAARVAGRGQNSLGVLWVKGMGDIQWRVSFFQEEDKVRLTSVADTQNYDLALYPIPRADSVPDELREIVDNPIFRSDELTLEAVQARAYKVSDAGDTSGPRMRFGVLYGEVLVEVNVKGAAPEAIYEILSEIGE